MRTVFMGTPDLAAEVLSGLINSNHEVAAVVTQPDRPKGRGGEMSMSPVKLLALEKGIPVLQPEKASDENFLNELRSLEPEIIVVAAFGQFLPSSVLELPRLGCINVHASLLPKYRGASPIQWSIINGDEKTGVTIMYMEKGIDTGDIIEQQEVLISRDETAGTLHDKLAKAGAELLLYTMGKLEDGSAVRTKQPEEGASYVKMLTKNMGRIDFNKPAEHIERLIRGLNPWPSAYTVYKGKTLKLWEAQVIENSGRGSVKAQPGTVVENEESLYVMTGDGILEVTQLQLEGKRRMSAEEFLRGCRIQIGEVLGA